MTPTIGRIVHYFPGTNDAEARSNGVKVDEPVAAVIVRVWSDATVNLQVITDCGPGVLARTSVQHKDVRPESSESPYWDWPERV